MRAAEPRVPWRHGEAAMAAGLYAVVALLLLVALTLVAVPANQEDERWLRTGSVMVTIGLCAWLPLHGLMPAVVLLWSLPLVARLLLGEAAPIGWENAALLPALLMLAGGFRYVYLVTRSMLNRRSGMAATLPVVAGPPRTAPPSDPPAEGSSDRRSRRPLSPWVPRISAADAAALLLRLGSLDGEVQRTGELLRAARG